MGCGASADGSSNGDDDKNNTTNAAQREITQNKALRYGKYPSPEKVRSKFVPQYSRLLTGRSDPTYSHPKSIRAEDKTGIQSQIQTSSGLVLIHSHAATECQVLFFYPETSYIDGKSPATCVKDAKKVIYKPKLTKKQMEQQKRENATIMSSPLTFFEKKFDDFMESDAEKKQRLRKERREKEQQELEAKSKMAAGAWEGIRVQFKEFDSLDDVFKRWYEDGDCIPGVLAVESCGPCAAFATLSPHQYQQRYVLPNGARTATFADDFPSVPQRIYRCYNEFHGEKFLKRLIKSIDDCLNFPGSKFILMAISDTVDDLSKDCIDSASYETIRSQFEDLDIPEILECLLEIMTEDQMGTWESVRQMPYLKLGKTFLDFLSYVEDAAVYNWFEVAVEAETELGTFYYQKRDAVKRAMQKKSFGDMLMKGALTVAEAAADATYEALKHKTFESAKELLELIFREEDTVKVDRVCDVLFPDLEDLVKMDLETIDTELIGISEQLPLPLVERSEADVEELFDRWRKEDQRPVDARRKELYVSTCTAYEQYFENAGNNGDQLVSISKIARLPVVLPRHFVNFTFYLVFPLQKSTTTSPRKPKEAELVLWPENFPGMRARAKMTDLYIEDGDEKCSFAIDTAVETLDDGDNTIDRDDDEDPRHEWESYPNADWRGFKVDVEVALEVNYSYNFSLDGHLFLDHNSFFTRSQLSENVYYRRVRFHEKVRRYTCNPLKVLGLHL